MNTKNLRDFNSMDWMGNAGAENPAPGVEPKIYEDPRDYFQILVDKNGVEARIYMKNDDFEVTGQSIWMLDCAFAVGCAVAEDFINTDTVTFAALKSYGFTHGMDEDFSV